MLFRSAPLPPSILEARPPATPWAFFRLLERGSATPRGAQTLSATFIVGGRDLLYSFRFGTQRIPYNLPALEQFRCPTGM